uniref:Uncharacterized protein n=1 Tax=Romanomermis culicivorax TaxID=13658 RepID=A0A915JVF6_ROMCU
MPLHAAIDCDKDDIVEILLSYSRLTNPTLANEDGHNALHLACIKGKTRLISKILLVSPELINVSNKRGFAPIHLAVFHNQVIALRLILEQQKFIHVNGRIMRNRDYNSFTALHLAVSKMFPKCVETLIDQGKAELSLTEDINQMTPFHVAVENLIKTGGKFSVENLFHLQQIPPHLATLVPKNDRFEMLRDDVRHDRIRILQNIKL